MRQDALVQHVGVAENDVAARTNGSSRILRRVAVIGIHAELAGTAGGTKDVRPLHQIVELIVSEGFRRIEVKGSRIGVFNDALEDREVVTEGLSGSCRRNDDNVVPERRELE